jgi:GxxExxY protein
VCISVHLHDLYKQWQLTTQFIPDLVVHDRIVVKLKAVSTLLPASAAQLRNDM